MSENASTPPSKEIVKKEISVVVETVEMPKSTFFILVILFFALSPAIFFRLPPKGSCFLTAIVHAFLFAFSLRLLSPRVAVFAEGFKSKYAKA